MKPIEYKFLQYPRGANKGGGQFSVWVDCFMGRCFYQDIAPTIRTRTDGTNMDFIMEEVKETICLNSKVNGKQPSVADRIYSVEGCAVALTSGWKQNIAEPISVAMRGRNPNNPSERGKSNGNYKQRLEMNESGVANTITSVQKDSMVAEPMCSVHPNSHKFEFNPETSIKPISPALRATDYKAPHCVYEPQVEQIGNIVDDTNIGFKNPQRGRIYSDEGLAPCLNCCEGGGLEPKIVQKFGDRGTDQYSVRDIAHTIPANPMSDRGQMLLEPSENWQTVVGNKQLNPFRGSIEGTSPCITSACGAGGGMTPMLTDADLETTKTKEFIEQVRGHEEMRYRIRKLTPRECFRLMGVDDVDIDKIQASGISNSQQYKCAGNSIVVDVLYHIFRKMFCEPENESDQLTLF